MSDSKNAYAQLVAYFHCRRKTMNSNPHGATQSATSIPPDDPKRSLIVSQADDPSLPQRLLCICSPAGQEEFFAQVGIPVATRTTASPKLDDKAPAEFRAQAAALAPKYKTGLLQHT
jgi:hypothetical protein